MSGIIRVVIVEDQEALLDCIGLELNASPETECVGAFRSYELAEASLKELSPDVVLLDISMPGLGGIEGCRRLKRLGALARMKVVMFTGHYDQAHVVAAMQAGCDGYLCKMASRSELVLGIQAAMRGENPTSQKATDSLYGWVHRVAPNIKPLSPTETALLEACATGDKTQKEIAYIFMMSPNTMKTHLRRARDKTLAKSTAHLATLRRQIA